MHLSPAYLVVVTVSNVTSSRPLLCDACATNQTDAKFSISCKIGRRTEIFRKISKQLSAETKSAIFQTFQRVWPTPLTQESLIFRAFPDSVMSTMTRDNLNISLNHASDTRFSDFVLNISRNIASPHKLVTLTTPPE